MQKMPNYAKGNLTNVKTNYAMDRYMKPAQTKLEIDQVELEMDCNQSCPSLTSLLANMSSQDLPDYATSKTKKEGVPLVAFPHDSYKHMPYGSAVEAANPTEQFTSQELQQLQLDLSDYGRSCTNVSKLSLILSTCSLLSSENSFSEDMDSENEVCSASGNKKFKTDPKPNKKDRYGAVENFSLGQLFADITPATRTATLGLPECPKNQTKSFENQKPSKRYHRSQPEQSLSFDLKNDQIQVIWSAASIASGSLGQRFAAVNVGSKESTHHATLTECQQAQQNKSVIAVLGANKFRPNKRILRKGLKKTKDESPRKRVNAPSVQQISPRRQHCRRWSKQEDQRLQEGVAMFGVSQWCKIAKYVGTRNNKMCAQRWRHNLRPEMKVVKKGKWTKEEDVKLQQLVHENDFEDTRIWEIISQGMDFSRNSKQCRERWVNFLDPTLSFESWTAKEDEELLRLHRELGNAWKKMMSTLKGRSAEHIRRRFSQLNRKKKKSKKKI